MKKLFGKLLGEAKPTPSRSEPIVIVSGLPRSGTSMMMKMLEAGGIPPLTDKLRTADNDNPKGYYEFERVKQMDKGDTGWMAQAQGKVVKVDAQKQRAIVEGVNISKKATKPNAKNPQGGIIEQESAIHISNLQVLDPKSGKPTRIGRKQNAAGKLVRFAKKSGEEIK